jgi:cyanate lyase
MLRAGMDEHEIMLLFKQPFINTIINNIGIIPPDPMILKHIDNLNDMFGTAVSVKEIIKNDFSDYNFTSEMLALNIAKYHRYIRIQDKEERLTTIP